MIPKTRPAAPGLSRRSFVALCGAAPALAVAAPSASEAARLDAFRDLSARLTGFGLADLDAGFAADLLAALLEAGHGTGIEALLAGQRGSEAAALETAIAAAWYSGILPLSSGPVVGALRDALVWKAVDFASPPGMCDGLDSWAMPAFLRATDALPVRAEAAEAARAGQAMPAQHRETQANRAALARRRAERDRAEQGHAEPA